MVGNVEAPEKWGQSTTLGEVLEYFDVGVVGSVSVENTVFEGVMECPDMLPEG
jgi:hypothetical protein